MQLVPFEPVAMYLDEESHSGFGKNSSPYGRIDTASQHCTTNQEVPGTKVVKTLVDWKIT